MLLREIAEAPVTVTADQRWVTIRGGKAFGVSLRDYRFWIDVDWATAPLGKAEATITVKGATTIEVPLDAVRATPQQEKDARGTFGWLGSARAETGVTRKAVATRRTD